jgi:hypothetical protein
MYLVESATPLAVPAESIHLAAALWQFLGRRGVAVGIIAAGGSPPALISASHDPRLDEAAAGFIANHCGATVRDGGHVRELITCSEVVAGVGIAPVDRRFRLKNEQWHFQRYDPLDAVYTALLTTPRTCVAGVVITLRPVPGETFLGSILVFASGPWARSMAGSITASYGGIGVRGYRKIAPRRAVRRALDGRLGRPAHLLTAEELAEYWHPPIESTREGGGEAPAWGVSRGGHQTRQ